MSARRALAQLGSFLSRVNLALMESSSGAARVRRIEALNAKTDEELAVMGLKRDEIVYHVFKDLYYV
ncbi:hypothetical protein ABMC89_01065 [Sulfitobacter sp. HNIBRBA3233]|uniref:hypothetical protein n=1 Tax=Sulfitobacter marinivivus TaxID=3158558 RepID=UPI0032DFC86A